MKNFEWNGAGDDFIDAKWLEDGAVEFTVGDFTGAPAMGATMPLSEARRLRDWLSAGIADAEGRAP